MGSPGEARFGISFTEKQGLKVFGNFSECRVVQTTKVSAYKSPNQSAPK
jgi:hypothetical protein